MLPDELRTLSGRFSAARLLPSLDQRLPRERLLNPLRERLLGMRDTDADSALNVVVCLAARHFEIHKDAI